MTTISTVWEDPIVREVREAREQIFAEHQRDIRALCKHLQTRETQELRPLVSRPPRKPIFSGRHSSG